MYNTSQRYVIDRKKTEEIIKVIINDYNSRLNYNTRAYKVEFNDFVDLTAQVMDPIREEQELLQNYKRNTKSFYFYGEYINGKVENFGYRIRDYRDVSTNNDYYPYIGNALRLVMNTKIYLPVFNIERDISFGYDLDLEKIDKTNIEE